MFGPCETFHHSSSQPLSLWSFLLDLTVMVVAGQTSDPGIQVPDPSLILLEKGPGNLGCSRLGGLPQLCTHIHRSLPPAAWRPGIELLGWKLASY